MKQEHYSNTWECSFLGVRWQEWHLEELLTMAKVLQPYLVESQEDVAA
jgi:hypothetical protein